MTLKHSRNRPDVFSLLITIVIILHMYSSSLVEMQGKVKGIHMTMTSPLTSFLNSSSVNKFVKVVSKFQTLDRQEW